MKNPIIKLFAGAVLTAAAGLNFSFAMTGTVPDYQKLLTAADVAKVSGIQGVKLIDKDPKKGAGGDLNFAKPDGKIVLIVFFEKVSPDEFRKEEKSKSFQSMFYGPVAGIGDAAYEGPKKGDRYMFAFLKGTAWITVSSFFNLPKSMKPILSQKQLRDIAGIIISRL